MNTDLDELTEPQQRYIELAYEVSRVGDGIYFSLWSFGHTNTGKALLRRGFIERACLTPWIYQLSKKGITAAETLILNRINTTDHGEKDAD